MQKAPHASSLNTSAVYQTVYDLMPAEFVNKVNESYTENALKMMKKRYLQIKEDGTQETPAEMLFRISRATAIVEQKYGATDQEVNLHIHDFYDVMARKEFTPAGRSVTNAGAKTAVVANCIVLGIDDSMESIFQTLKEAALLQQKGSGLGFDYSHLRPAMTPTIKSQGVSSGPVSFLQAYDAAFATIKQQGRHGANMAMMSVEHPDILDFISCKEKEGDIRNFNISVKVTDAFMEAVTERPDELWYCNWKGAAQKPQQVNRAANGAVLSVEETDITARELFNILVDHAWLNGEPGIVFIDEVNRTNPLPGLGDIDCSNPCGEQFLHHYDNCNLGSINLAAFVHDGVMDWDRLREVTAISTRFLDNVIDLFDFPVAQVTELAKNNRRIGLGIMGFGDMLFQMGVPYNSEEGLEMGERAMSTITDAAHQTSRRLAHQKGEFPNIELSIYGETYGGKKTPMRNAALTTVAPTGSISMMFDTSSGIEPNFALTFIKQDKDGVKYHYFNRHFKNALEKLGLSDTELENVKNEVVAQGSVQNVSVLPDEFKRTFVVAMDISAQDHMKMQAAFQKHVDNSISKTINFKNDATHEDVAEGFISAWRLHCKSSTVYRDGSREVQILNVGKDEKDIRAPHEIGKDGVKQAETKVASEPQEPAVAKAFTNGIKAKERPAVMTGKTYRMKTGYGSLFVTVNDDEHGRPFEVFATIGKSGGFYQEQSEGMCRMISIALRAGVSVSDIIDQLKGIRGPSIAFTEHGTVYSLPDAIGRVLELHVSSQAVKKEDVATALTHTEMLLEAKEEDPVLVSTQKPLFTEEKSIANLGHAPGCPDCGEMLRMSEGCMSCPNCGFSRCG